jgi:tetratricopeptide (TPR) repeat protein
MKNIFFIFLSVFFVVNGFANEQKAKEYLQKGNERYSNSKYDAAIEAYQKVDSLGFESAALYYNMGNAYYKLNKISHAILYYERAQRLAPGDEDINFNLKMARANTVDKIEKLPDFFLNRWLASLADAMSSKGWSVFFITSFLILLAFLGLFLFSARRGLRKFGFSFAVITLVLCIFSFIFADTQKSELASRKQAIIMAPTITAYSEPDLASTELFNLHEGTKVTIIEKSDNWRKIKIDDGNIAWIKANHMEVI